MISVIAPAWQSYPILIPSMLLQDDPNWTLKILHDGPNEDFMGMTEKYADPRVTVGCSHKRANCWGHNLRRLMLEEMEDDGDYVVISNHDNYFLPNFISKLRPHNEDMVVWNVLHNYFDYTELDAKIQFGSIDIMMAACKKSLAKKVGWKSFENASDYPFLQECFQRSASFHKIDSVLGVHN